MLIFSILISLLLNIPASPFEIDTVKNHNDLSISIETDQNASGSIKGRIVYAKGATKKTLKVIKDEKTCGTGDLIDESLVTDENGGLLWTVISIEGGVAGQNDLSKLNSGYTLDQLNCVFSPHVALTGVNQDLTITNQDKTLHNVRTISFMNDPINKIQMYLPGGEAPSDKFSFSEPEVIEVKCDVHGWMKAYVHVVEHQYYAVTNSAGEFEITGLPNGKYTLNVWHEFLGVMSKEIVVNDGEASDVELVYN